MAAHNDFANITYKKSILKLKPNKGGGVTVKKETESNINETYSHIESYLYDLKSTEELREMCKNCEAYCGEQHNYEECRDKMCFKFFLAFRYLEWSNSFR